jgi:hypoxanthine phosphoribosyltransferase
VHDDPALIARFEAAPEQTLHATIEDVETLSRALAVKIATLTPSLDLVVGVANGGLLPAKIVGEVLGLPVSMIRVRKKGSRWKQRMGRVAHAIGIPPRLILWGPLRSLWVIFQQRTRSLEVDGDALEFDVCDRRVVLVDDVVETGATFRLIELRLREAGAQSVSTAAICWSAMPGVPAAGARPDVHLHRQIQFYPWSNNTIHRGSFQAWLARNGLSLWW